MARTRDGPSLRVCHRRSRSPKRKTPLRPRPEPKTLRRAITVGGEESFGVEGYTLAPEQEGGAIDTQAGSHPFHVTGSFTVKQTSRVWFVAMRNSASARTPKPEQFILRASTSLSVAVVVMGRRGSTVVGGLGGVPCAVARSRAPRSGIDRALSQGADAAASGSLAASANSHGVRVPITSPLNRLRLPYTTHVVSTAP
jgi:hypothetical protein